jgi:exodeoxyribonuclease VII large subunit
MSELVMPTSLTVTQANQLVNDALAREVGEILVEGEVSDVRIRRDTWLSFTLKDDESSVECFSHVRTVNVPLEDGMTVRVLAKPKLYVPYGKYSLNLIAVELTGEGAFRRAYELLMRKLEAEGLFAETRKRPLPKYPATIGLITSGEGAALHDIRRVLAERWGGFTLQLYPVAVQGRDAVDSIQTALGYFNTQSTCDLLILTRGGGSLEDLQAFNDERIVRAVAASRIPTIVAVGHESDTSIAELVADKRAATPSNAAQSAVPDRDTVALQLDRTETHMTASIADRIRRNQRTIETLVTRSQSLQRSLQHALERTQGELLHWSRSYLTKIEAFTSDLTIRKTGLKRTTRLRLESSILAAKNLTARVTQLGPDQVLARGYSFTIDQASGSILRSIKELAPRQQLTTQLADGQITSEVTAVNLSS